jgi:hypothetical protein
LIPGIFLRPFSDKAFVTFIYEENKARFTDNSSWMIAGNHEFSIFEKPIYVLR